ncbi:PilX N-terminal domain-containing pilus assembly protein [Thermus albus]|uniref:PilX N-terminal domain-containing pilus assembly protein n=1 Tax=Thermus albus TaxID=2908146 RepID=UPI001FAA77EE|nr:PilX N-terminal domain-containing pilus assembly protein [Thermus albus]
MRQGFALVSVLILMVVLMTLLTAYMFTTLTELRTTASSARQTTGFYAAEAGLNLRAEEIRQRFLGFNRPQGTSPSTQGPCQGNNQGSGDFQCKSYTISGRTVRTYVREAPGNPQNVTIPQGELYEGLDAQEYRYHLFSEALGPDGRTEALLEMVFKSRLVPMFQFAAFYNKDLEILPGPSMTLGGRVHTNGDLYLDAGNNSILTIGGQVSTAGSLYRGRKDNNTCTGTVEVYRNSQEKGTLACGGGGQRRAYGQNDLTWWNGRIQVGVNHVTVPPPDELDPIPGKTYWDKADLRIGLDLTGLIPLVRVYSVSGNATLENVVATSALQACNAVGYSGNTFYNKREGKYIKMLEVDLGRLLDCIHSNTGAFGFSLDDDTEGGLVFFLTVFGPDSNHINNYGVRIKGGRRIASTISGAPKPKGLTIVSDQAVYIQGDFNKVDWVPAAVLADTINILSNNWSDSNSTGDISSRIATDTEVNAAFLAGTDITGGAEGPAGQDRGNYNGGLENYPRFHENWTNKTFTYRGSFVSLGTPRKTNSPWPGTGRVYNPPIRNWSFDTRFAQGQLPPLSPRFVYLKQERFIRDFERKSSTSD